MSTPPSANIPNHNLPHDNTAARVLTAIHTPNTAGTGSRSKAAPSRTQPDGSTPCSSDSHHATPSRRQSHTHTNGTTPTTTIETAPLYHAPSPLWAVRNALHAQYIEGWIATRAHARALEQVLAGDLDDATAVENALEESLRLGEIDSLPPKSLWQRMMHRAPYEDDRYPILRNRPKIASPTALRAAESAIASLRAAQYLRRQWYPSNCEDILRLHGVLFDEIYPWAGQRRIVEISKGNTSFCPTNDFEQVERHIDELLAAWLRWQPGMGRAAEQLAELATWILWWHPAREGNGRTTMMALCALAHARGITLHVDRIHRDEWMQASRTALSGFSRKTPSGHPGSEAFVPLFRAMISTAILPS